MLTPKPALTIALDAPSGRTPIEVGGLVVAPNNAEAPLAFADGTRVTLERGSRARIASVDAHGARVLLEYGELHANVAHLRGANWTFDAGPFQVLVTGTRFDVTWDPETESLVVSLLEGSVNVRGLLAREHGPARRCGAAAACILQGSQCFDWAADFAGDGCAVVRDPQPPEEPKPASAIPIAALPSAASPSPSTQTSRPTVATSAVAPAAPEPSKPAMARHRGGHCD
jgi:hypothetical protein